MKKLVVLLAIFVLSGTFAGCGISGTTEERQRRLSQKDVLERSMFLDDWDSFWLSKRSSRLNKNFIQAGR